MKTSLLNKSRVLAASIKLAFAASRGRNLSTLQVGCLRRKVASKLTVSLFTVDHN